MNQLDINSYPVLLGEEYKMRKSWLKKGLVCGIILLFVGTSFIPSISGNFVEIIKKDLNSPKTLHLTGDLICYWKFDEGNGSIAHDSSGNGYDGNIYGATWTTGKYGSGLEITGTSYVADIPFSSILSKCLCELATSFKNDA